MAVAASPEVSTPVSSAASRRTPGLLNGVPATGKVNVSDIAHLRGDALRKEMVARARALRPLLEANAAQTEADRRVAEENIIAIQQAGLYRIMVPHRFGGLEADLRTKMEVSAALGEGCGSTAWASTLMNVNSLFLGMANARLQEDVWGKNPDARIAGVLSPTATTRKVEGGIVVTGKWPWSSGCLHTNWMMMGCPLMNEAGEMTDHVVAVMPAEDCTIEDTWYVAGMKGSGSNTVAADEVFVPDHRLISVSKLAMGIPQTPYTDEVLYRCAFTPVAALILVGPVMGFVKRALEFVIEKSSKRNISYTFYAKQTESPSFQLAVADAAMEVDTVWLHALRACADIYAAAEEGRQMTYEQRARVRMDTGYVAETARHCMDTLMSAHGASSFAESSPMQRIWRDLGTCTRHAVVSPNISREVYGKVLLGMDGSAVTQLV